MWIPGASPGADRLDFRCRAVWRNSPDRGFSQLPNRPFAALKQRQKILFIQQLDCIDFALGATALSWHKDSRLGPH
jgi:hypothetical protein